MDHPSVTRPAATTRRPGRLLAAVVVSLLVGSLALAVPTAATGETAAADRATTSDPVARHATAPSKADVLERNRLYRTGTMTTVGCAPASQEPLDDAAGLQAYYSSVLPCMDQAWKSRWKKLRKAGVRFRAPGLEVHNGTSSSPCGTPGHLSFYCPRNKTIYMYDAEIVNPWNAYPGDDYSHGLTRLAATHVLAHEYGHHLQQLVGVLRAIGPRYRGRMERRAELQASCLGNVWLSAQRDAYPILADYAERPELWRYINVANHGSIANQETWTERGYDSASARSCNTFTAGRRSVS